MAQHGREQIAKRGSHVAVSREFHVGPLPPADELAKLEAIQAGLVDRVVKMAEAQSAHRQAIEKAVVEGNVGAQARGQWFAFILGLVAAGLGAWLIYLGHEWAGVVLIGLDLIGLATVFVTGRLAQARERAERRPDPPPKAS